MIHCDIYASNRALQKKSKFRKIRFHIMVNPLISTRALIKFWGFKGGWGTYYRGALNRGFTVFEFNTRTRKMK